MVWLLSSANRIMLEKATALPPPPITAVVPTEIMLLWVSGQSDSLQQEGDIGKIGPSLFFKQKSFFLMMPQRLHMNPNITLSFWPIQPICIDIARAVPGNWHDLQGQGHGGHGIVCTAVSLLEKTRK